jgi:hypothetical protein
MLVMLFGIIELGRAYDISQSMTALSREGANIAARGTALDTVLDMTMLNGEPIGLSDKGGTIVTELTVQNDVPIVTDQTASPGYRPRSKLGKKGDEVPSLARSGQIDGRVYFVVELFYDHEPITPLANLIGRIVPDTIYDRAIF